MSIRDPQSLSVRDLTPALLKVFLSKRYAAIFTDADISSIDDEQIRWNLIYRELSEKTNTHVLAIEYFFFVFRFQMSIMRPKLKKDAKRNHNETIRAKNEKWNLNRKFRIISSSFRAEALGLCGLEPEKEYPLIEIERINRRMVIVYYFSELYSNRTDPYLLPERYGDMVTEDDIEKNKLW